MSDKPSVLILGGTGFIGRNLVSMLVTNDMCSSIVVADKNMPLTSFFCKEHLTPFANKELVKFKQSDLTKAVHVNKVFNEMDVSYDYVINLCGETRFGLTDNDYTIKIEETARACVQAALDSGTVKKWVEISTAQVYKPDKKPSTEESKERPWTKLAVARQNAETIVRESGIDYVVLRPAIVYGKGDLTGLSPRLVNGVVYQYLGEKLKFLWGDSLGLACVHVEDVCGAVWACCTGATESGQVFNLADKANLTQGKLNKMLEQLFGIEAGYFGAVMSSLAKTKLTDVSEQANEKHVPAWTRLCDEHKINNTPLSPYIDKELLYNNSMVVDGSRIETSGLYTYTKPEITVQLLAEQIKTFEAQGVWPGGFLKI